MNRFLVSMAFICMGAFLAPGLEPLLEGPVEAQEPELEPLGTCSITNLPTTGTITAARLNSRYSQIESCINGGIDNTNWDSGGTGLANSNLANPNNYVHIPIGPLDCSGTVTSAFTTRIPQSATLTDAYVRCQQCSSSNIDVDIQIAGVMQLSFAGIAGSTLQSSLGNSYAVGSTDDIEVDITVTSAPGTCDLDVTLVLTTAHTAN